MGGKINETDIKSGLLPETSTHIPPTAGTIQASAISSRAGLNRNIRYYTFLDSICQEEVFGRIGLYREYFVLLVSKNR
jgi:hypothetical protein